MPTALPEGTSTQAAAVPVVPSPPPPLPPDESVTHRCANCLAPLSGPFCWQCGQHVADYHRSVWRFVADFFENTFCWDNKLLRTLNPLLKRPGWLTQEFMAGRRVRYVHPLRLFLFTSAICLTLIQYVHRDPEAHHRANRKSEAKPGVTVSTDADEDDEDEAKEPASPQPATGSAPMPTPSPTSAPAITPAPDSKPAEPTLGQVFQDTYKPGSKNFHPLNPADAEKLGKQWETIGDNIQKKIETAERTGAFREKMTTNLQQKLSWVTLAMLPIFALLMRWAYGRWGGYYFTYLVFSLHYHTFLLLFWVAYSCLDAMASRVNNALFELPGFFVGLCLLLPPYYLYRALRQMYGQGRLATVAKASVVGALHLLALFTGLAIIGATSLL